MGKKLGVLGGMGSEATSYFFEQLVNQTIADNDQDHIDTVILNHASLPDRTDAIIKNDTTELLRKLIDDVKLLEKIGVNHIAIPCNTAHYFYEDIQKETTVVIINMVEETVKHILKTFKNVKKIGIMGTTGTIEAGVYSRECTKVSVEAIYPSRMRQEDIMSLIYKDIKCGKRGDPSKFERVYNELTALGCDVIILACTELSVFAKDYNVSSNCVDALGILVKESIIKSDGQIKK